MRWWLPSLFAFVACGASPLPHGSTAEDCGACHQAQHQDWLTTTHARSTRSPAFIALLSEVEFSWGTSARAQCVSCHQPGFGGDEAIGCVTCHGAIGNRGASGGALVVSLDTPLAGTKRVETEAHRVEPRPPLRSASLCITCHEVTGPALANEPTGSEFARTPFARGDDCLGCHLASDEGTSASRHRIVGVCPPWGAAPEVRAASLESALSLWRRALSLEVTVAASSVEVTVRNVGAGHAVPTGAAHMRDVWVDVSMVDADGRRFDLERVMALGALLTREDAPVAIITRADRVELRGLDYGAQRVAHLALPSDGRAPFRVTATLRAQAVRAEAMAALQLEAFADEVPVLDVAVVEGVAPGR